MPTVILALALALSACAGRLENEERFVVCTQDEVATLLASKCGMCHSAMTKQANLDLVSGPIGERLMGMPSDEAGECGGRTMVSADGDHLLLEKLESSPSCGSRMPLGTSLTAAEIDCVRGWISNVAAEAP